jgi:rhomboid protease GluP
MCPQCRAFITTSDKVCPYCDTPVGPRAIDVRSPGDILGGLIPHAHFTTALILTINIGLYVATMVFSMQSGHGTLMDIDGRTLFAFGGKLRAAILLGQWWRLITAGFLHGGLFHILMNMWVLLDLGRQVEEVYGARRFITLYFASTVFGFMASTFWSENLSIGASAGVFGLIGAMIALGVRHRTPLGDAIRGHYLRWAIYGFVIGLIPGFRVDNAAHLGGLAAGFVGAYLMGTPSLVENWREWLWKVTAIGSVALTVLAFAQMYLWFARG